MLVREEILLKKVYERAIMNGFKKRKKISIGPGEYFDFLPYYIEKKEFNKDNGLKAKKEKINLWYEAFS